MCAADVGDRALARRVDAADQRAAIRVAGRQHRLAQHVRRGGLHVRIRAAPPWRPRVVGERRQAADLDVRRHREDPVAQLLLEPVHHRQHDDQRGDAERDARHRRQRDERDERVAARAATRARVAKADGELERRQGGSVEAGESASCARCAQGRRRGADYRMRLLDSARSRLVPHAHPRLASPCMHLVLVLPDLARVARCATRGAPAPALAQRARIARAGRTRDADGLAAALAPQYGVARQQDWPLAAAPARGARRRPAATATGLPPTR